MKKYKQKRILITAGPTWVPIDKVRVISNIASGETGILLAKKLIGLGAKVTLLLGPVENVSKSFGFKLARFRFFDELKGAIFRELKTKKYDIVIHSAAVSDYGPIKIYNRKIPSGIKRLRFELAPTVKIINLIKKIAPAVFLAGFKFEPGATRKKLLREAKNLIKVANLDLAVANTIDAKGYSAYILNNGVIYGPLSNKEKMVNRLAAILRKEVWKS